MTNHRHLFAAGIASIIAGAGLAVVIAGSVVNAPVPANAQMLKCNSGYTGCLGDTAVAHEQCHRACDVSYSQKDPLNAQCKGSCNHENDKAGDQCFQLYCDQPK